jgi:hypothetical protein
MTPRTDDQSRYDQPVFRRARTAHIDLSAIYSSRQFGEYFFEKDIPELPIGQGALETNLCQVTVALADFRLDEIGQLEGRLVAELTDPSRK